MCRLSEQKAKRRRGKAGAVGGTPKVMSGAQIGAAGSGEDRKPAEGSEAASAATTNGMAGHPAYRGAPAEGHEDSPYPERHHEFAESGGGGAAAAERPFYHHHESGGRHHQDRHHRDYHHYHHHHHKQHHEGLFYSRRRCKSESLLNFSRPVEEEMLLAAAWRLRHRR
jgi:hypothetical protein